MARSLPPRMHWRRWLKLHSVSPLPEAALSAAAEQRRAAGVEINYDSFPPQMDERTVANNPAPLRVFPIKKTDINRFNR